MFMQTLGQIVSYSEQKHFCGALFLMWVDCKNKTEFVMLAFSYPSYVWRPLQNLRLQIKWRFFENLKWIAIVHIWCRSIFSERRINSERSNESTVQYSCWVQLVTVYMEFIIDLTVKRVQRFMLWCNSAVVIHPEHAISQNKTDFKNAIINKENMLNC